MACGRAPFADSHPIRLIESILNGQCSRPRKVNTEIDPAVEVVILRALNPDPVLRYRNGMELAAALEPLVVGRRYRGVKLRPGKAVAKWVSRLSGILTYARPLIGF